MINRMSTGELIEYRQDLLSLCDKYNDNEPIRLGIYTALAQVNERLEHDNNIFGSNILVDSEGSN